MIKATITGEDGEDVRRVGRSVSVPSSMGNLGGSSGSRTMREEEALSTCKIPISGDWLHATTNISL